MNNALSPLPASPETTSPLLYCAEDTADGYSWPWCWENGTRRIVWARCVGADVTVHGEEIRKAA